MTTLAATRRHVSAMGVSPWNASRAMRSAATRRHVVAMGVSPWISSRAMRLAATRRHDVAMSPIPWNPSRAMRSAATRRHVVAMGVSPWNADPKLRFSPNGATRGVARGIRVAPLGLGACRAANHGLTPVATACRPVGTESQRRMPRLVAELHAQFAESAKRCRFPFHSSQFALHTSTRGLSYGA